MHSDDTDLPAFVAGVCALTTIETDISVAAAVQRIATSAGLPSVFFKGSYKKSNRTTLEAFDGVGVHAGASILGQIRSELKMAIATDVHETKDVALIADVADMLVIPALLCKQTDLIVEAGRTGKIVNIKKGQFVPAADMHAAADKALLSGASKVVITERGTNFGYEDTIVDFRSFGIIAPVHTMYFDVTHSARYIGKRSNDGAGGKRRWMSLLSRCAAMAGASGLYVETYENPADSPSDSVVAVDFDELEALLADFLSVWRFRKSLGPEVQLSEVSLGDQSE